MDNTTTRRSEKIDLLLKALAEVQPQLHVKKNKQGQVGQQKYLYADLATVWDACRDLLKAKDLVVLHNSEPTPAGDGVTVTATLYHTAGEQWMSSSITMKPRSMNPQDMGSALTYGRRYTLASLVGIVVDDDDDGKKASATPKSSLAEQKKKLREALRLYQGEDAEEVRQLCTDANTHGTFDQKFLDGILKRTSIVLQ